MKTAATLSNQKTRRTLLAVASRGWTRSCRALVAVSDHAVADGVTVTAVRDAAVGSEGAGRRQTARTETRQRMMPRLGSREDRGREADGEAQAEAEEEVGQAVEPRRETMGPLPLLRSLRRSRIRRHPLRSWATPKEAGRRRKKPGRRRKSRRTGA